MDWVRNDEKETVNDNATVDRRGRKKKIYCADCKKTGKGQKKMTTS